MDENRAADFTETMTQSACNEDEESRAMITRRRHFYQCCFSNLTTDEPLQLEIGCCLKRLSIYPYEKVSQAAVEESSLNLEVMAGGVASRKTEGSVVQLFESPQVVRFLKFLLVTIIYIIITHSVIRWMVRFIRSVRLLSLHRACFSPYQCDVFACTINRIQQDRT